MTTIPRTPHFDPEVRKLQEFLDRRGASRGSPRVLEAGCGSLSHLQFDDPHLVGIDISEKQLARHRRLAEAIYGDIQTHELPPQSFDLIICWDVLEHLEEPRRAVENFARAIKPGGLIVLAMPNLFSTKGMMTKLTPHPVHVWAYRRFWGVEKAGTDDLGPFRTYLRLDIAPGALKRFARERGLTIEHFSSYESMMQKRLRKDHRLANVILAAIGAVSRILTLGRVDMNHTDYILVLGKPGPAP